MTTGDLFLGGLIVVIIIEFAYGLKLWSDIKNDRR